MIYITLGIQHDMDILEPFKKAILPMRIRGTFSPFLMIWNPEIKILEVVPWLKPLVLGHSLHRSMFDSRPVHVGYVVDELALG